MIKNFISKNFNVFKYASVQILSKGLTLLATYAIALYATNEVFGYISLIQATLVTVITLFGFNLSNGVIRYYFEVSSKKILKSIFPILFFLFIVSIIASIYLYLLFENDIFYIWFSILPLAGFFNGCILIFSILSRAKGLFFYYALAELMRPFFLIFVSILFIFYSVDIISYFSLALFLSSIICFFSLLCVIRNFDNNIDVGNLDTKKIFFYTLPLFFVQLMSLVNNVSDKFIMQLFVSMHDIGLYGKCYLIGSSLGLLFDSLMLLWTPYVMRNKLRIYSKNKEHLIKFVLIILALSVIFFVFSIFIYMSEKKYYFDSYIIATTLIVISAFVSRIGYQVLSPLISAFDKTKWLASISAVSMLLGVFFNLLLIPYIGAIGAAISTYLSFFIYSLMSIYLIRRLNNHVV
ncbi:MAG: hypothetical protein EON51_08400 [Acinetobacter sp.]|nr:MAG: hypothetical protein EON51_08400 [Acinetobacter sp.]